MLDTMRTENLPTLKRGWVEDHPDAAYEQVQRHGAHIITVNGHPGAVMVSRRDFEEWREVRNAMG